MTYKNYDPMVKKMIIETGNINLFPELKIPRSTALYWVQKSKSPVVALSSGKIEKAQIVELKKEIFKVKAINLVLKKLLGEAFDGADMQSLFGRDKKRKIVEIVEEMKELLSITEILQLMKITPTMYYRYRTEILGCKQTRKFCESNRPNQLSKKEQAVMVSLARDKRLAYLSIRGLMYHAQREGILYCGIDSWYKYLKLNKIVREMKIGRKPKKRWVGIRASRPHELWHIDITEIQIKNNEKYYLQMVVDNYSRAILSWKISDKKTMEISLATLKRAFRENSIVPDYILSDGGGENKNKKVKRLLLGRGICQLIAHSDVFFSNSMIEAVFRQLKARKNLFLKKTRSSLHRFVASFVKLHNYFSPHSSLGGARPCEVLEESWSQAEFTFQVKKARKDLVLERAQSYQACRLCLN